MEILIADDDRNSNALLKKALENFGHNVSVSENGRAAFKNYMNLHSQLIILDWEMPEMNGLEVCRLIRAVHLQEYAYIIVLTGARTDRENLLECLNAGADDFMTKPLDIDELEARLTVAQRILDIQSHTRTLENLLRACSYCKKINVKEDSEEDWIPLEDYITRHSPYLVSHGVCPQCYEETVKRELRELHQKHGTSSSEVPDSSG